MKTYSAASDDVLKHIVSMQSQYHPEIENVTVGALFAFDEETGEPVLKHQGYAAAAVVSITSTKQRALGVPDAVIVIDRATWLTLNAARKDALIDHELEHLDRVISKDTEDSPAAPQFDSIGRPKLTMRRHDHQFGWFDDVARRHGEHSPEMIQAKALVAQTQQLYFDFAPMPPEAALEAKKRGGSRVSAH
jgi:hypothetical protein